LSKLTNHPRAKKPDSLLKLKLGFLATPGQTPTEATEPMKVEKPQRAWFTIKALNYSADVWLLEWNPSRDG
jgi:hypothetical protein